jgi:hypothetical protein
MSKLPEDVSSKNNSKEIISSESPSTTSAWLGGTAVLFFILAAIYFLKMVVDSGWLTPMRQFSLAITAGFGFIGTGIKLKDKSERYASLLPGVGLVVLYLTVYVGHLQWALFDGFVAFWLSIAVSFFAVYLFRIFPSDFFLVASICGTYYSTADFPQSGWTAPYLVLWQLVYSYLAILLKKRTLLGLNGYLGLITWFWSGGFQAAEFNAVFQAAQFGVFALSVAFYSIITKETLSARESWLLLPVLLIFYFTEYNYMSSFLDTAVVSWIALFFAGALLLLYKITCRSLDKTSLESAPALFLGVAIILTHAGYFRLLPEIYAPWFAIALVLFFSLFAKRSLPFDKFWPLYAFVYGIGGLHYMELISRPESTSGSYETTTLNFIYSGIFLGSYWVVGRSSSQGIWLLLLSLPQALTGFARFSNLILESPDSNYLSSTLSGLLAVSLLFSAYKLLDQVLAKVSLMLLGFVVLKVLLFEIHNATNGIMIIALMAIGCILYISGFIWDRIVKKSMAMNNKNQDRTSSK